MAKILGWTSAYGSPYREEILTKDRKQALIECVKRRHYDFTYNDLCYLPNCAPIFADKTVSIPSRSEWNEILDTAYAETPRTHRLTPLDTIKRSPIDEILYEKKEDQPKDGDNNG